MENTPDKHENQAPGNYSVEFDGSRLTSGVYVYQFNTGSFLATKKMLLIK